MITKLYRHYDQNDTLLYVGISLNVAARLAQHRVFAEWFDRIVKITIENFASRSEALTAERQTIENEKPLFNRTFSDIRKLSNSSKPLLTVKDLAQALNKSRVTVHNMLRDGRCPVKPVEGMKPPKFRATDVEAFLCEREA